MFWKETNCSDCALHTYTRTTPPTTRSLDTVTSAGVPSMAPTTQRYVCSSTCGAGMICPVCPKIQQITSRQNKKERDSLATFSITPGQQKAGQIQKLSMHPRTKLEMMPTARSSGR
eukprot:m.14106 g.14106  ORF g.14106 m.14106 type:complete len:116 (-) comp21723_c0_seq2:393-740(-)